MTRIEASGDQTFVHNDILLEPTDRLYINYANWSGNGGTLELGIDQGRTGTISKNISLTDQG